MWYIRVDFVKVAYLSFTVLLVLGMALLRYTEYVLLQSDLVYSHFTHSLVTTAIDDFTAVHGYKK